MGVIEGHRPVAHDAPPPEGVSLGEKVVVFHALPGVQPLQVRLVGHAAVDEEVVGGEQDLRHGLQEGQLRAEAGPHHLPQSGQLLRPRVSKPAACPICTSRQRSRHTST